MKTLTHNIAIYVPSAFDVVIDAVCRDGVQYFGGCSVEAVQGSYSDKDGVLVEEQVSKVMAWFDGSMKENNAAVLMLRRALIRLFALGEESVLVERDCHATLYFPEDLECL